jgi:hypothetical protein
VLAFGDELLYLVLPCPEPWRARWLSPGGRDLAAAYLLPRAEAALRQELQRLADAVKIARHGQSSSSRQQQQHQHQHHQQQQLLQAASSAL